MLSNLLFSDQAGLVPRVLRLRRHSLLLPEKLHAETANLSRTSTSLAVDSLNNNASIHNPITFITKQKASKPLPVKIFKLNAPNPVAALGPYILGVVGIIAAVYETFCAGRRAELAHIQQPAANASDEQWSSFCSRKLLWSQAGVSGFVTWEMAKRVFTFFITVKISLR